MVKSRDSLKSAFRSGAIPTSSDFAALIDSLAHVDDLAAIQTEVDQIDARTGAVEQATQLPTTLMLDADGTWQILKSGVDTLCAFEILAQVEKSKISPLTAITHAVAISGASPTKPSIRQTQSYTQRFWPLATIALAVLTVVFAAPLVATTGLFEQILPAVDAFLKLGSILTWGTAAVSAISVLGIVTLLAFRNQRAISVAWRPGKAATDAGKTYDLVIRTGCTYGTKTQKVQMICQIKRLWN